MFATNLSLSETKALTVTALAAHCLILILFKAENIEEKYFLLNVLI